MESIRNLTLNEEDYEIIVIDDCSTDETVSIIEDWRKSIDDRWIDDRLTILRQSENHRQGAARNRGVKEAKGEYICFVDADDVVTEGIVKAIWMANEKKADMVPYHLAYAEENGNITKEEVHLSFEEGQIFTGIEMQNKHPYWLSGPVAYIYSKEVLVSVDYPFAEGVLYEDSDFVMAHILKAQRMAYSLELGYIAYTRQGSTTHSMSHRNLTDYLLLGTRMLKIYESADKSIAEGILHGACYNVCKSLNSLYRLQTVNEVRAFYNRVDAYIDRKQLYEDYRIHTYFWNMWNSICIRHKYLTIILLSCMIPMYKLVKRR